MSEFQIATQISSWASKLLSAKREYRKAIFDEFVAPSEAIFQEAHSDFLNYYEKTRQIISNLRTISKTRPNDVASRLDAVKQQVHELGDLRQRGRSERRKLYEEIEWRSKLPDAGYRYGKMALQEDESKLLSDLHFAVIMYFEREESVYAHDLPRHKHLVEMIIDKIENGDFEGVERKLDLQLRMIDELEDQRNELWAEFAKAFTKLKHKTGRNR